MDPITVTINQVLTAGLFVVLAMALLWMNRSGLEKLFLIGALRSLIQLWVMGYVLVWLFGFEQAWVHLLVIQMMIVVATYTAGKRQDHFSFSMFCSLLLALQATVLVIGGVLYVAVFRVIPWENPHVFIPVMGMAIGNSANGAALLMHRMTGEIRSHRGQIESALALGASPKQAMYPFVKTTLRNALIPTINAMMMIGIVQIPGIMTGQILAGISPEQAMKYQVIILFMLSSATVCTCHLTIELEIRRLFSQRWALPSEE